MSSVYNTSREQFEQRMRARRAATCLTVARSAIASGRLIEAIDRLEEACALDADAAEARLLLEELRVQEAAEPRSEDLETRPAPRTELAGWSHWLAAALAICALAALALLWPPAKPATGRGEAVPGRQAPALPVPEAPSAVQAQAPPESTTVRLRNPVGTSGLSAALEPPPRAREEQARVPGDEAMSVAGGERTPSLVKERLPIVPPRTTDAGTGAPPLPAVAARDANAPPSSSSVAPGAPASPGAPAPVLPPLDRVTVNAEDPSKLVPSEAVSASPVAPPSARTADVPAEASFYGVGSESSEIEETLHRYADAYARLDADAARDVWPTVDQRALARAFQGLESQGLTFEHCEVTVAGAQATAACSGRARYVPKVGSREPLVEQRQWTFRLRKADAGWKIVQAEAR